MGSDVLNDRMKKAQLIRTLWDLVNSHKACVTECSLCGELRNVVKAAENGQIKRPYLSQMRQSRKLT